MPKNVSSVRTSQVHRRGVSCGPMKTPDTTLNPLLPFQIDPAPATNTLPPSAACRWWPRPVGHRAPAERRPPSPLKHRQRDIDEATLVESFVLMNAAGGDGLEDFRRLAEEPGLPTRRGHALPLPDAARKFLYAFHRDEAIVRAQTQRPVGPSVCIPEDTKPWQGLAR